MSAAIVITLVALVIALVAQRYADALLALALALALALIAGCSGPLLLQAADASRPGWLIELTPEIEDACDLLEVECALTRKRWGAVRLDVIATDDHVRGHAGGPWCESTAIADRDPLVIAHELGHVLGLEHVDDASNLMYFETEGGWDLTDAQRDQIEAGVARIGACRP